MNAIQFIKENGVDKAREVVDKNHECYMPEVFKYWSEQLQDFVLAPKYASCLVSDLKHLVESMDLIESNGGYESIKDNFYFAWAHGADELTEYGERLKQAIADYESIYSNDCEILDYPEDYTSPNCKKYDERVK